MNISDARRLLEKLAHTNDADCKQKLKNDCIACFQVRFLRIITVWYRV